MSRTEDRLADALHTVARSVREETLPPLQARAPSPRRRWVIRLAPAFAAAAVALAVALSLLAGHTGSPAPPAVSGPPPAYYAVLTGNAVQIRSTITGALTATVRAQQANWTSADAVAAAPGGRKFFVAFGATLISGTNRSELYSFEITSSGQVTGFASVKNGTFDNAQIGNTMAVSPDGSRLAFSLARFTSASTSAYHATIEVINPSTGARQQWSGGLDRAGLEPLLGSISREGNNGPLIFLAQWCTGGQFLGLCISSQSGAQVRTLDLAGSGSLADGAVLLSSSSRYPYLQQALLGGGGSSLVLAELTGLSKHADPKSFQLLQVPLGRSGPSQLLYQGKLHGRGVCVRYDASGQHLIIAVAQNGWLDHGRFRLLPPQQGEAYCNAW